MLSNEGEVGAIAFATVITTFPIKASVSGKGKVGTEIWAPKWKWKNKKGKGNGKTFAV